MKNRTLFIIGIVLTALSSCNNKSDSKGKRLRVYTLHNSKKAVTAD